MKMIERQTIVTWYTPEEKKPPEGDIVVVSISGRQSANVTFDHAFALAELYDDCEGWTLSDIEMESFTVHAWCDLMPYGGGLPSAQPVARDTNVLSNDNISRQDAIRIVDGIDTWQAGWRGDAIESLKALPSAQPEDCSTCKHGHFNDRQCDYCGVRYPSHYERDENE